MEEQLFHLFHPRQRELGERMAVGLSDMHETDVALDNAQVFECGKAMVPWIIVAWLTA